MGAYLGGYLCRYLGGHLGHRVSVQVTDQVRRLLPLGEALDRLRSQIMQTLSAQFEKRR